MPGEIFDIDCPCCGAVITVDGSSGAVLDHIPPKPKDGKPEDLGQALSALKKEEAGRAAKFEEQFAANKKHEKDLADRFEGLLKKTKSEGPVKPGLRDLDWD